MAGPYFDLWLDRLSKVASILVPVLLGCYAQYYTTQKDAADAKDQQMKQTADQYQKDFDNASRRYENLAALIPVLTGSNCDAKRSGLQIYSSEANASQAPQDLNPLIERIKMGAESQGCHLEEEAGKALAAGNVQAAKDRQRCFPNEPDGIYIHVANSDAQLAAGRKLATMLAVPDLSVRGVQRVDQNPNGIQLRYYATVANDLMAGAIQM